MKPLKTLSLFVVMAAVLLSKCGSGHDREIEIRDWQVLYSQSPSLDEIAALPEWKPIAIPGMFVLPYAPKRDIQFLWLKADFSVDNPEDFHGISIGRVYYVDTVYINKKLVGRHLTTTIQDIHFPRNYEIQPGTLVKGINRIHIYLGIYGKEYGGFADHIRLMSKNRFLQTAILMEFLFRQLTVGILVLFLGQIIFIIIQLLWRNHEAITFISLMIFLLWISYLMALFSPYYPVDIDFRITVLWGCACFVPIFFFLFIQYYYRIFLTTVNMIYIPLLVIFTILSVINQDTTSPYYLGRYLGVASLVISIPAHMVLLFYINRRKPGKTLIYFIILGVIPGMTICWDIVSYVFVQHIPPLYHIYTLPGIVILFMTLRVKDAMSREIQLEILYDKLRTQIEKGAGEAPGDESRQTAEETLTRAMEDKLNKVIDFLKNNYLSDISREGLAKAMDLSPDHMSRKFKSYTGYKISDYINKLRIEEAAAKLLDSDRKIIDIAFAVGFESLVTFNRAFLKVMDMTPSEYRRRNAAPGQLPDDGQN